jgi:hypothetical protein
MKNALKTMARKDSIRKSTTNNIPTPELYKNMGMHPEQVEVLMN